MATIKKNQLANIVFPMVDGTDFASVESGLTASDFESKVTKKYFGVTHGNSTAFTSGTISKAATLVRSGIFQQTLKAAETNFDYVMYSFQPSNTSLAHQMLVFQPVDYDDSDIFSQLSDIGSNLLSYLTGISAAISDVDSQLLLNASLISDIDSQLLLNASVISDVQSALDSQFVYVSNVLSDMESNLLSYLAGISGAISDVDSQLLLNASLISDVDSQVNLLATSDYLSQVHSDLRSQISGITASVSASDISDIASRVWAEKYTAHSLASSFGSLFSDVYSRLVLTQSNVSDIDSQLTITHSLLSDVESQVDLLTTSNYLSQVHSDLRSQISGITASVSASDMSDIASRVWATTEGVRVDSRILVIQSLVSDVDSQLLLNASVISDIQSALDSQFLVITSNISDVDSQLLLNASIISDVYSLLSDLNSDFDSKIGSALTSVVTRISQIDSGVDRLQQAHIALIGSVASTVADASVVEVDGIAHHSQFNGQFIRILDGSQIQELRLITDTNLTTSQLTVQPAFNSRLLSGVNFIIYDGNPWQSAVHSDLYSAIGNVSVALTASDISDIASAVADAVGSDISDVYSLLQDVDSQLTVTHSLLSDVESQVDLLTTSNYLSQVHSDLRSQISGITASIGASDISDIASAVWADVIGARVDSRVTLIQSNVSDVESQLDVTHSQVSDIYSLLSDVESQVDLNASVASDIQSALDSQFTYLSAAISDAHSDLYSAIGDITVTLTASDISDIASGVLAGLSAVVFPAGAIDYTYTVTNTVSSNPIPGVDVWISTDLAQTNIIWRGITDAFGVARDVNDNLPALDAGTYYFWSQKAGFTFVNPDTEVVS